MKYKMVRAGNHFFVQQDVGDAVPIDFARCDSEEDAAIIVRACNNYPALTSTLALVLAGLESGSVKSKPILDTSNPEAESYEMVSLASIIRAALTAAGA